MDEIKILCVDDEKNVLRALERAFMEEDYEIITAENGEEGLKVLQENPDVLVILSDYRMPEMDGIAFLKKAYEQTPNTIRIVLSGYADTASVVSAINEGKIYKFIPKPWNDEDLILTVKEAVEVYNLKQKNERLADMLMEANDELTKLNRGLEEQVAVRTAELEFQIKAMSFAHNLMDVLPAAVIGMTPDGLIVMGNKLSELIFSESPKSLVGMQASQFFPEGLQKVTADVLEKGHAEEVISINGRNYLVRGTRLPPEQRRDPDQEGIVLMLDRKPV